MANRYLPVSINTKEKKVLVVGGGLVAKRKIDTMLSYDTQITVIAPEVDPKINFYADNNKVTLEQREYRQPEAASYNIVIAASDDQSVNQQVYDDTRNSGAIINVVDQPALCDFIFPAVTKRDSLTIAVSTDGKAPFLSGHLRLILDAIFPEHWNRVMKLAVDFRHKVQQAFPDDLADRNDCFQRFVHADWKAMIKNKNNAELEAELEKLLKPLPRDENQED